MWNELDTLIKNNIHTENHRSIYSCLLECHKFNLDDTDKLSEKVELDQALRELDQMGKFTFFVSIFHVLSYLFVTDPDTQRASVIRATTDSPMSPPPLASIAPPLARSAVSRASGIYSTPRSLFEIITFQDKAKTRPDFCGRSGDNPLSKLYPNLKQDSDWVPRGDAMEAE